MKMPEGLNQFNLRLPDELLARLKKFQLELSTTRDKLTSIHSIIIEAIEEKLKRG
jgi:predicted DNA-binding protein